MNVIPPGEHDPEAGPRAEHPAKRAARMIRELHVENIELIDGGHVFLKDGVDVNDAMRRSSQEQIVICDQIMARADTMDAAHFEPAALILREVTSTVQKAVDNGDVLASIIPEIGNFDHGD